MPETYTKEQIDVLKMAVDYYSKRYGDNKPANGLRAILSALSTAEKNNADWQEYNAELLHRAETAERERDALKAQVAELEARMQSAGWISVEERLPKSGKFVLANVDELSTPIRAFYAAPNSVEGSCEDEISIFDEEADCYWLPVGWYETNEYEEVSWFVHGKVTHWMPLPEPPAIVGKKEG